MPRIQLPPELQPFRTADRSYLHGAHRLLRAVSHTQKESMIRKLKSGEYRLYSRKKNESTGKRRNLGTFSTLEQAKQHEREVQYFKKH
jgi:hypothetical protein